MNPAIRPSTHFGPMPYNLRDSGPGAPISTLVMPEWDNVPLDQIQSDPLVTIISTRSVELINDSDQPIGMGVWINGHIITARHILDEHPSCKVKCSDGSIHAMDTVILDDHYDAAIIQCKGHGPATVIAFNPNPIGRYACIYNNNGQRVVSSGDIVGETQYAHSEFLLNIPLNPGASGTGVFTMDGHCIGIMIYHQKKYGHVRQFLPFTQLRPLLQHTDIQTDIGAHQFLMPTIGIGVYSNGQLTPGPGEYEVFTTSDAETLGKKLAQAIMQNNENEPIDTWIEQLWAYKYSGIFTMAHGFSEAQLQLFQSLNFNHIETCLDALTTTHGELKGLQNEQIAANKDLKTILTEHHFNKESYRHDTALPENQGHKPNQNSLWVSTFDKGLAVSIDNSPNAGGNTVKAFYKGHYIGTYSRELKFMGHGKENTNPHCGKNRSKLTGKNQKYLDTLI